MLEIRNLRERRDSLYQTAKNIVSKAEAEKRSLTEAELKDWEGVTEKLRKQAERSIARMKFVGTSDLDKSVAIREKELELQKLQNQMEEQAAANRHKNLRDFMVEMQGQSKNAGDILYDAAHDALNKISDDFGNLVEHPTKTNVSKMFGDHSRPN